MKKTSYRIIYIFIITLLALSLISCKNKKNKTTITTYQVEFIHDGEKLCLVELQ